MRLGFALQAGGIPVRPDQLDLVRPALTGKEVDLLAQHRCEVEGLERECELTFLDPLQIEEIVDQPRQARCLAVNRRRVAPSLFLVDVAVDEELGEADDARKRRA